MSDDDTPAGFLSRWSQRKTKVREGQSLPEPAAAAELPQTAPAKVPAAVSPPAPAAPPEPAAAAEAPLPLTLDDVAQLGRDSDYRKFLAPDVTPEVKNAALKKLFTDPHFNVMDGLDIYIDDYGKPDPISPSMLRQMVQSKALGLFADEEEKDPAVAPTTARATPDGAQSEDTAQSTPEPANPIAHDQDAAVRLQPLDAAGPPGAAGSTEPDPGRER